MIPPPICSASIFFFTLTSFLILTQSQKSYPVKLSGPQYDYGKPLVFLAGNPLAFLTYFVVFSNSTVYTININFLRGGKMNTISKRIKHYRNQLHLSQEYVSHYLKISRSTYSQMENGNRRITADEIAKLSSLFGVSADSLLNPAEYSPPAMMFARSFEKLSETDQAEIMNLIRFKEKIKTKRFE